VDESILSATLLLLGEVGYARLTMEQVAARAGVGMASLYLRGPSKVALVAGEAASNPELREAFRRGVAPALLDGVRVIVQRAVDRGELPAPPTSSCCRCCPWRCCSSCG
jgi:AcrR family transcriptional regulator